ncbi:MAG TPA: inositol-3-phosphate synthase [Planctomycetota bacterium]|jgi:myo-inositol-1-phosphate synthase
MAEHIGVWIIGARGAVSTCVISGARAIARGLAPTTGLVTELSDFHALKLAGIDKLIFGGHELRSEVTLQQAADELRDTARILPAPLVEALREDYAAVDKNIRMATAIGCGQTVRKLTAGPALEDSATVKLIVEQLQADILDFKKRHELRRVIVLNLASTEPYPETQPAFYGDLKSFREAVRESREGFTAGVLYAYAALELGMPYLNFTPSLGSDIPALQELALTKKIPHGGKDGKTGETLMKTVLAPMFVARNLKVMSWEGYNMFGNRDAVVLDDPKNNEAKTRGKDKALREILGDSSDLHTRVRIDYCPSLDDWKTAYDFIHFQGFLGTRMILQFIWQGCDSMLAAPLALDLVRLMDYAQRQGESGPQVHLSCFFKNPLHNRTHDFWQQWEHLRAYVKEHAEAAVVKEKTKR